MLNARKSTSFFSLDSIIEMKQKKKINPKEQDESSMGALDSLPQDLIFPIVDAIRNWAELTSNEEERQRETRSVTSSIFYL